MGVQSFPGGATPRTPRSMPDPKAKISDRQDDPDPVEVASALRVGIGVITRRLRQSPLRDDLTAPEMSALSRLERDGPTTPSALARAEQITPQGMGTTLGGLVRRGLVSRRPDPEDGRRTVMSLTEDGRKVVRTKRSARTQQLADVLSDRFTREELEILRAAAPLIERLGEAL
jgi:DNA-binding MarR family transcriptional regulator